MNSANSMEVAGHIVSHFEDTTVALANVDVFYTLICGVLVFSMPCYVLVLFARRM